MFSLARALFSATSAEDVSSLFGGFIDNMARSDSSEACTSALWLCASRTGLVPFRAEALQRSRGARACCFSACADSKTTQDRRRAPAYRETAMLPSSQRGGVGVLMLIARPTGIPVYASDLTSKFEGESQRWDYFCGGLWEKGTLVEH